MKINEYQKLAMKTLNPELSERDVLINGVMGLCGESGEAIDIVKKHLAQGHPLDKEALAKELGPSGIRVNCVAPGVILTDMCASVDPEVLAEMAEETPVGRNGRPEDVAKAFAYLADADFITGQVIPVNGGYVI